MEEWEKKQIGKTLIEQPRPIDMDEEREDSVVNHWLTTAADGKNYRVAHYNLDAILAVGYRVRSPRGVQFRRWASNVLAEYLKKGFVMDDERLKNPDGRPDYFDEMLARIRDIRASEKRFWKLPKEDNGCKKGQEDSFIYCSRAMSRPDTYDLCKLRR